VRNTFFFLSLDRLWRNSPTHMIVILERSEESQFLHYVQDKSSAAPQNDITTSLMGEDIGEGVRCAGGTFRE
jgi:hypothetical protein